MPHLLVGVLLVVGCAVGGVVVAAEIGERETVLVLARPVTVGQEIAAADVRAVTMAVDPGIDVVSGDAVEDVAGRTAAYSLPAGTILTRGVLGDAQLPPPGQAFTAVPLAAGQFPPGLQPGHAVQVVAGVTDDAIDGAGAPAPASWAAVVTAVQHDEGAVASLQMDADDSREMASWPAEALRLVVVAGVGGAS
ncbi:SAF domain-containing protein [Streptomyces sp. SBT349]|uniref:SAF domain-containing protein n=1 Tax=Streptomyces sp. SBT349 TaxID=1580539 RepID=UPI00069F3F1F|nr:SAF domain-containing protein [Streptomyces sp. SBT349]